MFHGIAREKIVKRKRRSRAEWIEICEAFARSGDEATHFGRRRGVHPETLKWWSSRLRKEGVMGQAEPGFVEVVSEPSECAAGAVVRVGRVEIEFQDGVPPAAWIAELATRC